MRRRIFWLVIATTSVVVVSFVVPLCLLVRTIAQDRAMAAADQEARSVAILVTRVRNQQQLTEVVEGLDPRGVAHTGVLTPDGTVVGELDVPPADSEVRRAADGEAALCRGVTDLAAGARESGVPAPRERCGACR